MLIAITYKDIFQKEKKKDFFSSNPVPNKKTLEIQRFGEEQNLNKVSWRVVRELNAFCGWLIWKFQECDTCPAMDC